MSRNSYQVRFSVLQAGVYGSPQNRRRVIFWGARRGLPLPEFPIPTHNFDSKLWAVQLDTGLRLDHVSRDPDRPHRGAPLRAVTVDDVISDLVSLSCQSFCRQLQSPLQSHHCVPLLISTFVCDLQPKFDWYVPPPLLCSNATSDESLDILSGTIGKTHIQL